VHFDTLFVAAMRDNAIDLKLILQENPAFLRGLNVSFFRANLVFVLSAALMASPAFATRTHRSTSSVHTRTTHKAAPKSQSHRLHGQQAIEPARVMEIQQALIREHYLTTEADGRWNANTEAAMQKYQADQGWQTKLMPDSRALQKLGLGPDYSTAINAKTSSFADPPPVSTIPSVQAAGFAQGSGVNR
jgi:peptidoglycan hydrolase-like protein with peptidoglycan-binding domain